MQFKDAVKWNTRVSALYAAGVWGMIGSYAYFRYTGQYKDITQVEENPNRFVHETAHSKTVIVYKEGFVPYTTRIYNLFKYLTGGSGDK
uniref:Small integral membrane protein 26 n=1 Tax=Amphiprion percula TaxID=161767 RepID=A0A3P8T0P9_AMPPE